MNKVKVKQPEGQEPIPATVLAQHIEQIANGMNQFYSSRIKEDTLVVLLADITKMAKRDIRTVLHAMRVLENVYLKPKPEKKQGA